MANRNLYLSFKRNTSYDIIKVLLELFAIPLSDSSEIS